MVKKTKEIFRLNLRRLVENTGRTLPEVAEDCEISLSFLNQLLSGKKSYSPETVDKLCKGLKCNQTDLFLDSSVEHAPKEQIRPTRNELLGIATLGLTALNDLQLRTAIDLIDRLAKGPATLNIKQVKLKD